MNKKKKIALENLAKRKPQKRQITEKEKAFTREYIIDKNGAGAAIRAGFSARVAKQQACALMKRKHVGDEIARLLQKQGERLEISADRVIKEIAKLAFSDICQLFDSGGLLKDVSSLENDVSATVSSVESLEEYDGHGDQKVLIGNTKKVKLWDKTKALEMLGRHFKLFSDVVITRDGDFLEKMEAAQKRLDEAKKK